jgi:hypothetical protein
MYSVVGQRAPDEAELAVWSVNIAVTRRGDGRYVGRVSFEDEAGWEQCVADTPERAFEQMTRVARRRLPLVHLPLG